ncbi:hypothetical protein CSOJ01_05521 [Colletotrichum sojae]|uniref:Uncharacterized protein n=1 Tax=Colletotrichum sojae TaxID=2175907 RepID=A0A8H6JFP4_9PEZI|nr:hypothetical protein CSOJ01_05521 [Colletotrichum sojae]
MCLELRRTALQYCRGRAVSPRNFPWDRREAQTKSSAEWESHQTVRKGASLEVHISNPTSQKTPSAMDSYSSRTRSTSRPEARQRTSGGRSSESSRHVKTTESERRREVPQGRSGYNRVVPKGRSGYN